MKLRFIIISIASLLLLPIAKGQVTIGSDVAPRKGSLLDLKENNSTGKNANAVRGLGLPRVRLESYTKLTIDVESKKNEYDGLTVYNVNTTGMPEGVYVWDGNVWKLVILVSSKGNTGNVLEGNSDNTYSWSDFSIPDFSFHRPTQTSSFDPLKATKYEYTWGQIVNTELPPTGESMWSPQAGLFNSHFIYSETLDIKTETDAEKYMLLEMTATVSKFTKGSNPPDYVTIQKSYWESLMVEILLDGEVIKDYTRVTSNPSGGIPISIVSLFSVIPLTDKGKGIHTIQIRISTPRHLYYTNGPNHSSPGNFDSTQNNFLTFEMVDMGLVLYEKE